MKKVNLLMWVTSVDSENGIILAEGHLEESELTYGLRHILKLPFDWIIENCREGTVEDLQKLGRMFYYEMSEDGREEVTMTIEAPLNPEAIAAINKKSAEWHSNLRWEC